MTTLGSMLLFRLRTIWKTVDRKLYPTRLIAQTLPLLTTICSGRCRTPSLEYGSHQNRVSKIGLIHSWPPSRRSSFGMESPNFQKYGKKSLLQMGNTSNNFDKKPHELSYRSNNLLNLNIQCFNTTSLFRLGLNANPCENDAHAIEDGNGQKRTLTRWNKTCRRLNGLSLMLNQEEQRKK